MADQQVVEIAKAVGSDARILLMDEPTASLTEIEAGRVFQLVRRLKADGVGIVYISHRLEEILAIADRITVLRDGQSVACRKAAEVGRDELIRPHGRPLDRIGISQARTFPSEKSLWKYGASAMRMRGLRTFPFR